MTTNNKPPFDAIWFVVKEHLEDLVEDIDKSLSHYVGLVTDGDVTSCTTHYILEILRWLAESNDPCADALLAQGWLTDIGKQIAIKEEDATYRRQHYGYSRGD
jgi:hypothetical protein